MVYLVGVNHCLQVWTTLRRNNQANRKLIQSFQDYLISTAKKLRIEVIAEEASEEWIEEHDGGCSVAKKVAEQLNLAHVFCNPNRHEHQQMGLRVGGELVAYAQQIALETGEDWETVHARERQNQFPAREQFWLNRLAAAALPCTQTLFICGADHTGSFGRLLKANGWDVSVYCRHWTLS